ncbi:MAG: hypothetical protein ACI9W4_000872 [Rhodothermales bacterium]|jgi:hypothetical protein
MKAILVAAAITVFGLGYLTQNPDPVADLIWTLQGGSRGFVGEEWLEDANAGLKSGNPYWEASFGLMLLEGIPGEIDADPERGRALVEQSVAKGLSSGLFLLWMLTGSTDADLLARAGELGDPLAIHTLLARALSDAECSPDGRASLAVPDVSRDMLAENYDRMISNYKTYPLPTSWNRDYLIGQERRYAKAADMFDMVHDGMECLPDDTESLFEMPE